MTKRHLAIRFDAPLMSFGGVAIDSIGATDAWPSASLLTGIIGNALGYRRTDDNALQKLQDRLVFACRADADGTQIHDFQTADIQSNDKGWTTRGEPEGRAGGTGTYQGKHIRYRTYWADRIVTIAMRFDPETEAPDLDQVYNALQEPKRPLFIGRKPCLPAAPLAAGWTEGTSALEALLKVEVKTTTPRHAPPHDLAALAPPHDPPHPFVNEQSRLLTMYAARVWASDVHGGGQQWREGRIATPPGGQT